MASAQMDGGDLTKKVRAGEPFRPSARQWNTFVDAARWVQDHSGKSQRSGILIEQTDTIRVRIRNSSGADVGRFGVLGISGPVIFPEDNLDEFNGNLVLDGVTPTSAHLGRFAIVLEPITASDESGLPGIGLAVVAGVTPGLVNLVSYNPAQPLFADAWPGNTSALQVVNEGAVKVLWADTDAGPGPVPAVLLLSGGSSSDCTTTYNPTTGTMDTVCDGQLVNSVPLCCNPCCVGLTCAAFTVTASTDPTIAVGTTGILTPHTITSPGPCPITTTVLAGVVPASNVTGSEATVLLFNAANCTLTVLQAGTGDLPQYFSAGTFSFTACCPNPMPTVIFATVTQADGFFAPLAGLVVPLVHNFAVTVSPCGYDPYGGGGWSQTGLPHLNSGAFGGNPAFTSCGLGFYLQCQFLVGNSPNWFFAAQGTCNQNLGDASHPPPTDEMPCWPIPNDGFSPSAAGKGTLTMGCTVSANGFYVQGGGGTPNAEAVAVMNTSNAGIPAFVNANGSDNLICGWTSGVAIPVPSDLQVKFSPTLTSAAPLAQWLMLQYFLGNLLLHSVSTATLQGVCCNPLDTGAPTLRTSNGTVTVQLTECYGGYGTGGGAGGKHAGCGCTNGAPANLCISVNGITGYPGGGYNPNGNITLPFVGTAGGTCYYGAVQQVGGITSLNGKGWWAEVIGGTPGLLRVGWYDNLAPATAGKWEAVAGFPPSCLFPATVAQAAGWGATAGANWPASITVNAC